MLSLISPSKTLDFESDCAPHGVSQCDYLTAAEELIALLRQKSPAELAALMSISPTLAELNFQRYREWSLPLTADIARSAIFAFKGDVYTGLTLDCYSETDFLFVPRIISASSRGSTDSYALSI